MPVTHAVHISIVIIVHAWKLIVKVLLISGVNYYGSAQA